MSFALPDALAGGRSHKERPKADFRAHPSSTSPPSSTLTALTPSPGRPGARTGRRSPRPGPPLLTQPSVSPRLLSFMLPRRYPRFFSRRSGLGGTCAPNFRTSHACL